MIPQKNRFHGHGSLRYVYKKGRAIRHHKLTLKFTNNPRRATPRIAVVVSKKVYKGAVGRNRIRRRLYGVIEKEIPLLKPTSDIVLIVSSADIRLMPADEVSEVCHRLLQEADLYKTPRSTAILSSSISETKEDT